MHIDIALSLMNLIKHRCLSVWILKTNLELIDDRFLKLRVVNEIFN